MTRRSSNPSDRKSTETGGVLPSTARVGSVRGLMLSLFAVVFAAAVAVFHGATYLLWQYERCRSGACRSGLSAADIGPFAAEFLALIVVVLSWPLGLMGWSRVQTGHGRPVVLVHGWGLNRASMALIAARLRRDGRTVYSEALPWRWPEVSSAATLTRRIREIREDCRSPAVDVVAYGTAGVLVRAAAQCEGTASLLGKVITLASPHRGTALAVFGLSGPLDQLRPGSAFLDELIRAEKSPVLAQVTAIASPFDAIVFPFDLAYLPGAFNVTVDGVGHFSMLYSERVYTLIAENLYP